MLRRLAQVSINQQDLPTRLRRLMAKLLAEILLPSPECGLVSRITWIRRFRRKKSIFVRIERYASAMSDRGWESQSKPTSSRSPICSSRMRLICPSTGIPSIERRSLTE